MNAPELVAAMLAAFRAAPIREGGREALYSTHKLRASLELVLESGEALLAEMEDKFAGIPVPRAVLELRGAHRELADVVRGIQEHAARKAGT